MKHVRSQPNFIEEIGSQSPYHIEVRWSSLEAVLAWYRKHCDALEAHLVQNDKEIAEDTPWWCCMLLLHEHFKTVGVAMKSLQYRTLLMESQSAIFLDLRNRLVNLPGLTHVSSSAVVGSANSPSTTPLTDEQLVSIAETGTGQNVVGKLGAWQVVYSSI